MSNVLLNLIPQFLSPSRAKDFMQCPQLFYFKTILKMKTPPSKAMLKGTIAHHVFEHIFDHPPEERNLILAKSYIIPALNSLLEPYYNEEIALSSQERSIRFKLYSSIAENSEEFNNLLLQANEYNSLFSDQDDKFKFVQEIETLVENWFTIENPMKFTPLYREKYFSSENDLAIHGYVDRVDLVTSNNEARYYITDYKSGKLPSLRYHEDYFFQLGLYALLLQEHTGVLPYKVRLVFVSETGANSPLEKIVTEEFLNSTREKISAIWDDIRHFAKTDSFTPKPQVLCDWCYFKDVCPAFNKDIYHTLREERELRNII